jgi:hypothetical protein
MISKALYSLFLFAAFHELCTDAYACKKPLQEAVAKDDDEQSQEEQEKSSGTNAIQEQEKIQQSDNPQLLQLNHETLLEKIELSEKTLQKITTLPHAQNNHLPAIVLQPDADGGLDGNPGQPFDEKAAGVQLLVHGPLEHGLLVQKIIVGGINRPVFGYSEPWETLFSYLAEETQCFALEARRIEEEIKKTKKDSPNFSQTSWYDDNTQDHASYWSREHDDGEKDCENLKIALDRLEDLLSTPSQEYHQLKKLLQELDDQHKNYCKISGVHFIPPSPLNDSGYTYQYAVFFQNESFIKTAHGWQLLKLVVDNVDLSSLTQLLCYGYTNITETKAQNDLTVLLGAAAFFKNINTFKLDIRRPLGRPFLWNKQFTSQLQKLQKLQYLRFGLEIRENLEICDYLTGILKGKKIEIGHYLNTLNSWHVEVFQEQCALHFSKKRNKIEVYTHSIIPTDGFFRLIENIGIVHQLDLGVLHHSSFLPSVAPYYFSNFVKLGTINKNLEKIRFSINMEDKRKIMDFMIKFEDGELQASNLPDLGKFPGASIKRPVHIIETIKDILTDEDLEGDWGDESNALALRDIAANKLTPDNVEELDQQLRDTQSFFDTVRRHHRARNQITLALQPLAQDTQKLNEKLAQENPSSILIRKEILSDILNDFLRPKKVEPDKIQSRKSL